MFSKLVKSGLVTLALLVAGGAHSAAILDAPTDPVLVGSTFEVDVAFAFGAPLGPDTSVGGFDFNVDSLLGVSFLDASVNPDFDAFVSPGAVSGFSLFGVPVVGDSIALATLTFMADTVGVGSGSIFGDPQDLLFPGGLQLIDGFGFPIDLLEIAGDFRVDVIEAASVPLPGTLALLMLGAFVVRRAK